MQRANDKVNDWLEWCAEHDELINIQKGGYNLTLHPGSVRGTFPGLSPFRVIYSKDIVHTLLELPSITMTSITSLLLGVALTLLTLWSVNKNNNNKNNCSYMRNIYAVIRNRTKRSLCVVVFAILSYWIYVRQRRARLRLVSGEINCSSSPRGPCNVTNNILMITNSHAGTHADCPYHFIEEKQINEEKDSISCSRVISSNNISTNFSNAHYNGNVIILDFSSVLHKYDEPAINTRVMREALNALPDIIQRGTEPLWRLICITRRYCTRNRNEDVDTAHSDATTQDKWEDTFAYFTVNAIVHLLERFPRLMLLATDAPSVDAPSASPIGEYVHGTLLASGVAIMENINGEPVYPLLRKMSQKKKLEHFFNEHNEEEQQELSEESSSYAQYSVHYEKHKCDDSSKQTTLFLRGMMSTTFNPMQDFRDSRGCSVVFFPANM